MSGNTYKEIQLPEKYSVAQEYLNLIIENKLTLIILINYFSFENDLKVEWVNDTGIVSGKFDFSKRYERDIEVINNEFFRFGFEDGDVDVPFHAINHIGCSETGSKIKFNSKDQTDIVSHKVDIYYRNNIDGKSIQIELHEELKEEVKLIIHNLKN